VPVERQHQRKKRRKSCCAWKKSCTSALSAGKGNHALRAIRLTRGAQVAYRPIGSFLFLGPTGVGKTEMRGRSHSYSAPTGSHPLRYVGVHGEALGLQAIGSPRATWATRRRPVLTERVKRSPYSVVLLDEIEEGASRCLHICSRFSRTAVDRRSGNTVDFKNVILIMTRTSARAICKRSRAWLRSDREDIVSDKGVEEL